MNLYADYEYYTSTYKGKLGKLSQHQLRRRVLM